MDPNTLRLLMGSAAAGAAEKIYVEDVFSTWTYTGNGSTQTITNNIDISGKGGLVWIKRRNSTNGHRLTDTTRGATKSLDSSTGGSQATESTGLTAFSASGFSIGADIDYNTNAATYTSWTFRKATKFFDIVTYTGNGTAGRTINHNLGSTPGCIIIKDLSVASDWLVWHRSETGGLFLDTSVGTSNQAAYYWGNGTTYTAPTSTTFTVGNDSTENINGDTFVAYIFAHDAGGFGNSDSDNVISCGSYTGNGNLTGPSVTLGWEPQWLLIKRTDSTGDWNLIDAQRGFTANGTDRELNPNSPNAESTGTFVIPTATGFQLETLDAGYNANAGTYIYIAIRRGLMKTPTDATKVFTASLGVSASPAFVSGFPIDLGIYQYRLSGFTDAGFVFDRLRGEKYVITNSTTSNTTDSLGKFDFMNGYYDYTGITSDYVSWMFRRAPGFFDAVAYKGTAANRTVSHNLAVTPELIIVKCVSSTGAWQIYSASLANTEYLVLNTTAAKATGTTRWNSTSPTTSVFSLGTDSTVNANGFNYIAYLFTSCTGISKVGSYTGTGTTLDVNCGFTAGARFVLIKRTDSTGDWYVWDTTRGIVSGNDPYLLLNAAGAENTGTDYIDPLSTGFQISSTAPAAINASGGSYIYLAIA